MTFLRTPSKVSLTKTQKVNALKLGCAMWLSKEGYWPFYEVILDAKQHLRADLFSINNRFEAVIVEVKSSREDFQSDTKWTDYLPFCSKFYFAADPETLEAIRTRVEQEHPDIGYVSLRNWAEISPYCVSEVKPARKLTFGRFSDPAFLMRLIRSNCLFIRGSYRGLRKVDKTLIAPQFDTTQQLQASLLLDVEER